MPDSRIATSWWRSPLIVSRLSSTFVDTTLALYEAYIGAWQKGIGNVSPQKVCQYQILRAILRSDSELRSRFVLGGELKMSTRVATAATC
jgi:hypothetical protein